MGIWEDLFGKHGHHDDEVIQELLAQIKRMQLEAIMSEQNERRLIKENERLFRELQRCLHQKQAHPVQLILTFNNQSKLKTMAVTLNPNQSVIGSLSLIDTVTGNPVVATFANPQATSDNPAAVTAVVNPDGTITATAVTPGTANITASADVSYTDSNGAAQTAIGIAAPVVAVSVAQPAADSVGLVLTFGTPTP